MLVLAEIEVGVIDKFAEWMENLVWVLLLASSGEEFEEVSFQLRVFNQFVEVFYFSERDIIIWREVSFKIS